MFEFRMLLARFGVDTSMKVGVTITEPDLRGRIESRPSKVKILISIVADPFGRPARESTKLAAASRVLSQVSMTLPLVSSRIAIFDVTFDRTAGITPLPLSGMLCFEK